MLKKVGLNQSSINFKQRVMVDGDREKLNEVAWYLQKKRKQSGSNFDFLDIRLDSQRPPTAGKYQLIEQVPIIQKVFGEFNVREDNEILDSSGLFKPSQNTVDLLITGRNKADIEKSGLMDAILEQSLEQDARHKNLIEKLGFFLETRNEVRESAFKGKPITSLRKDVVEQLMPGIKRAVVSADKLFEKITNIRVGDFSPRTVFSLRT